MAGHCHIKTLLYCVCGRINQQALESANVALAVAHIPCPEVASRAVQRGLRPGFVGCCAGRQPSPSGCSDVKRHKLDACHTQKQLDARSPAHDGGRFRGLAAASVEGHGLHAAMSCPEFGGGDDGVTVSQCEQVFVTGDKVINIACTLGCHKGAEHGKVVWVAQRRGV